MIMRSKFGLCLTSLALMAASMSSIQAAEGIGAGDLAKINTKRAQAYNQGAVIQNTVNVEQIFTPGGLGAVQCNAASIVANGTPRFGPRNEQTIVASNVTNVCVSN